MIHLVKLLFFLSPLTLFCQMVDLKFNSNRSLKVFSISDELHIITSNNLFRISENKPLKLNGDFEYFYDLEYLSDSLFIEKGGGTVLKMNSELKMDTLLNAPTMKTSFYNSAKVMLNDTIVSFGGYGNFNYNNSLTYFCKKNSDWRYYPDRTLEKNKPKPRAINPPYFLDGNELKIFKSVIKTDGGPESRSVDYKSFSYNFKKKKWSLNGESTQLTEILIQNKNYFYKHYILSFSNKTTQFVDLKKNIFYVLKNKDYEFSSINSFAIIGNQIFLIHKTNSNFKLKIMNIDEFLEDSSLINMELTFEKGYKTLYFSLIILLLLIVIYLSKNKNQLTIARIKKSIFSMENELTIQEKRLINKLIQDYPTPVLFKEISLFFDDTVSYETKKQKTRVTVNSLKKKLDNKLKVKDSLIVKRDITDKRAFVVLLSKIKE